MSLNRIELKVMMNRCILRLMRAKGERIKDCNSQEMIELEEVLVLTNHAKVKRRMK